MIALGALLISNSHEESVEPAADYQHQHCTIYTLYVWNILIIVYKNPSVSVNAKSTCNQKMTQFTKIL